MISACTSLPRLTTVTMSHHNPLGHQWLVSSGDFLCISSTQAVKLSLTCSMSYHDQNKYISPSSTKPFTAQQLSLVLLPLHH